MFEKVIEKNIFRGNWVKNEVLAGVTGNAQNFFCFEAFIIAIMIISRSNLVMP